jgi:hypothetical protein
MQPSVLWAGFGARAGRRPSKDRVSLLPAHHKISPKTQLGTQRAPWQLQLAPSALGTALALMRAHAGRQLGR